MSVVLRFIGDPIGYVTPWESSDRPSGWIEVFVGHGGHRVLVDADKAYRIDNPTGEVIDLDVERKRRRYIGA